MAKLLARRTARSIRAPIAEALPALIGRDQEIAQRLGISPAAVKNHVHTIFDMLDVTRRSRIGAQLHHARLPVRAAANVGIPASALVPSPKKEGRRGNADPLIVRKRLDQNLNSIPA